MTRQNLVDQSMKAFQHLPFEVSATPQDNDHLSRLYDNLTTPVNIKIRVKNKAESGLKRGVISVPRFGGNQNGKCMRVVKSDQTIMSFDLLIEPYNTKKSQKKNLFQMFKSGCFNTQNDDDDIPYMPSSSDRENHKTEINITKNNIDTENFTLRKHFVQDTTRVPIFLGKCKPGGCLDPPFNEDKYSYEPAIKISPVSKHDQKGSDDETFHTNNHILNLPNTKTETKSNMLMESQLDIETVKQSISGSTSIITYPPAISGSEIQMLKEKQNNGIRSKIPSERKLKHSINEFTELYMPSKKEKPQNVDETNRKSQNRFGSLYVNQKIDYSLTSQDQSKMSLDLIENLTPGHMINIQKSESKDDSERCKIVPTNTQNQDEISITSQDMHPVSRTKIIVPKDLNEPFSSPPKDRKKSLIPHFQNYIATVEGSKISEDIIQSSTHSRSEDQIKSFKISNENEISTPLSETKADDLLYDVIKVKSTSSLISDNKENSSIAINENLISNVVIEKIKSEIVDDIKEMSIFTENEVHREISSANLDKKMSDSSKNTNESHARRALSSAYLQYYDEVHPKNISLEKGESELRKSFSIQDEKKSAISKAENLTLSSVINSETSVQKSMPKDQLQIKNSEEYIKSPKITLEEPLNNFTKTIMNDPITHISSINLVSKNILENHEPKESLLKINDNLIIISKESLSHTTKNDNISNIKMSPIKSNELKNEVTELNAKLESASLKPDESLRINVKDVLQKQISNKSIESVDTVDTLSKKNYKAQNEKEDGPTSTPATSSTTKNDIISNIKMSPINSNELKNEVTELNAKLESASLEPNDSLRINVKDVLQKQISHKSIESIGTVDKLSKKNYKVQNEKQDGPSSTPSTSRTFTSPAKENIKYIMDSFLFHLLEEIKLTINEKLSEQSMLQRKAFLDKNYIIDDKITTTLNTRGDSITGSPNTSTEYLQQKPSADILSIMKDEFNHSVIERKSIQMDTNAEVSESKIPIVIRESTSKETSILPTQDTTKTSLLSEITFNNKPLKDTLTPSKKPKSLDSLLKIEKDQLDEIIINNGIQLDVHNRNVKNEYDIAKLKTKMSNARTKNVKNVSRALKDDMIKDSTQSKNIETSVVEIGEKIDIEQNKDIPKHILRSGSSFQKNDVQEKHLIAVNAKFRYLTNENNELILETCDPFMSEVEKPREKLLSTKTVLRKNYNQIRFSINSETDLTLEIKNPNITEKMRPDEPAAKAYMEPNKNLSDVKLVSNEQLLQEALNTVYESLLPLQNILTNIREEAQSLAKQQVVIKELLSSLETKPVRLNPEHECRCNKI